MTKTTTKLNGPVEAFDEATFKALFAERTYKMRRADDLVVGDWIVLSNDVHGRCYAYEIENIVVDTDLNVGVRVATIYTNGRASMLHRIWLRPDSFHGSIR